MSTTFAPVAGALTSSRASVVLTASSALLSVSVEFYPGSGAGQWQTIYADGQFSNLYRDSTHNPAVTSMTIVPATNWAGPFRIVATEAASTSSASYTLPAAPEAPPVPADAEAAEGTYELYQFHAERAAQNLTEFFRKPRNSAIMLAAGGEAQEAEDAAWQLYNAFDLETATGPVLDKLGALVGELRSGRTDEDYAAAVRARILVNRSNGRQEDLIAIAVALIPGNDAVILREYYPARIEMEISGSWGTVTTDTVGRMIRQAKAAGVGFLGVKVETNTMIWDSLTNTWGYDWSLIF